VQVTSHYRFAASAENKFIRRTAKYTWRDYRTNEDILSELKINPVVKKNSKLHK
jgi:hypothetical protein